jgi:hypothetical protein
LSKIVSLFVACLSVFISNWRGFEENGPCQKKNKWWEVLYWTPYLIGVMRWMVEFGCIDIATEVSLLFSHLAYPREGHLKTALHMMSYLSHKHNERLIIDPTYPKIDMGKFPQFNWTKFYGDVEEAIPVGMPEPLGKDVEVRMMCGSDHAEDKRTRCSCTGFLIFCNMALIDWVFKKQETIETSVFGAKFVAMKHRIKKL